MAVVLHGCRRQTFVPHEDALGTTAKGDEINGADLTLCDDFEGETLAAFWRPGNYGSGRYEPGAVALDTGYSRNGSCSVRITVHEGDIEQTGDSGQLNERAELDSGKHPLVGKDCWYGFSFLVPADFPIVDVRLVIAQWKQSALDGSPLIAQRFRDGTHYLTVRVPDGSPGEMRSYRLPELVVDRWHDMVYHIRFSTMDDGLVEVWVNGEKVVSHRGSIAFPDGEENIYQKMGLYRDRWPEPMTIYFDAFSLGDSFAAVDPARFDR